MSEKLSAFWHDESGPELVEWAVVTAILLFATAAGLIAVRGALIDLFQSTFDKLEEEPPTAVP